VVCCPLKALEAIGQPRMGGEPWHRAVGDGAGSQRGGEVGPRPLLRGVVVCGALAGAADRRLGEGLHGDDECQPDQRAQREPGVVLGQLHGCDAADYRDQHERGTGGRHVAHDGAQQPGEDRCGEAPRCGQPGDRQPVAGRAVAVVREFVGEDGHRLVLAEPTAGECVNEAGADCQALLR
jgi:hypothetical protein